MAKKYEFKGDPSLVKRKIVQMGTGKGITLSETALEFLEVDQGDTIEMNAYDGKHGKFIAIWKPKRG